MGSVESIGLRDDYCERERGLVLLIIFTKVVRYGAVQMVRLGGFDMLYREPNRGEAGVGG